MEMSGEQRQRQHTAWTADRAAALTRHRPQLLRDLIALLAKFAGEGINPELTMQMVRTIGFISQPADGAVMVARLLSFYECDWMAEARAGRVPERLCRQHIQVATVVRDYLVLSGLV